MRKGYFKTAGLAGVIGALMGILFLPILVTIKGPTVFSPFFLAEAQVSQNISNRDSNFSKS